jgi:hypothetical protein
MRRTRMMAMAGAAVCVFSMVGVAAAFAEPPEFQTQNKKTGEFEPLKKPVALTETSGSFEVRSASSDLVCAESTGKGKLTGPKTFTVKTTYTGCEDMDLGVTCQSSKKKAGVIKTAMMEGSLVEASAGLGLPSAAAASSPAITSYTCGTSKVAVTGLALGSVTPRNEPTGEFDVAYAEGAEPEPGCGTQELQLIDGLGPCVHLSVQVAMGPAEPAAMVAVVKKHTKSGHVTLLK